MSRAITRCRSASCAALMLLCASGCTLGPRQIHNGRLKYNEAVQRTFQEEMLLNLVRLKYREIPEFLSVGGIAAQYTFEGSSGAALTLPEGGTRVLGLNGAMKRSERPTISYAPARGEEFQKGLLAPIELESLQLLARTGWSWDRILRTTVQYMNEVDNATSAGGPTPEFKPEFENFRYLAQLFRQLQIEKGIELAFVEREDALVRVPLPQDQLDGDFVINALREGYKFREDADGLLLFKNNQDLAMIVHPDAKYSQVMQEIAHILGLRIDYDSPRPGVYAVESAREGWIQPATAAKPREDIVISTRSLLEVMFYLSQGIEVPLQHEAEGLVTLTVDHDGSPFDWTYMMGDLFTVMCCEKCPEHAAVAVPYEGYWFYIDDRDLNSRSTFMLLVELFGIEVRAGGGGGILYTLNVGG